MKQKIIQAFIAYFEQELAALIQSAKAAHLAATHEESRAEDRHDTFAIEASYLAAGQAVRVQDIRASIDELNYFLSHLNAKPDSSVEIGSLVTLQTQGKKTLSLIARFGGGTTVTCEGTIISLVSPTSPLGDAMLGLSVGEEVTLESRAGTRNHEILDIE